MSESRRLNYRKIYERYNGKIPKDANGRSYDIHHVDGDRTNNDPSNLVAITVKEHYEIHKSQKDWGACFKIAQRMKLSPEEHSDIARKLAQKLIDEGTHNLLKRTDGTSVASDRVKNGTHNLLKRSDGTSLTSDMMLNGTHPSFKYRGKDHYEYDRTIYKFLNIKTNTIISATKYDFYTTYNLNPSHVYHIISGKRKTHKGWRLINE